MELVLQQLEEQLRVELDPEKLANLHEMLADVYIRLEKVKTAMYHLKKAASYLKEEDLRRKEICHKILTLQDGTRYTQESSANVPRHDSPNTSDNALTQKVCFESTLDFDMSNNESLNQNCPLKLLLLSGNLNDSSVFQGTEKVTTIKKAIEELLHKEGNPLQIGFHSRLDHHDIPSSQDSVAETNAFGQALAHLQRFLSGNHAQPVAMLMWLLYLVALALQFAAAFCQRYLPLLASSLSQQASSESLQEGYA